MTLRALLLDMDGTLVDTEDSWWQATREVALGHGVALDADERDHLVGRSTADLARHLLRRGVDADVGAVGAEIDARVLEVLAAGVPVASGARRLLRHLRRAGIATALVSASPRCVVDLVVGHLGSGLFDVTVAAEDTVETKPFPDPYLLAVARLGVDAAECLVVEDSETGIASARAAGLPVTVVGPLSSAHGRAQEIGDLEL